MWELDCKEGWAPKNWCFWTVVLEKTLESPLDCQEIQPVHSKGDQPWDFFGRTDAESEKGEWKVGLELNIQKTKIMASCPITSWEIDGETVETVSDFILGDSKITADGDCSQDAYSLEEKLWPT